MPNLLFDYDGTLHDSMKIYAPSVQLAWDRLAAKGLTEPRTLSEEELRPCIGMTPDEMMACGDGFNDLSMIEYAGLGVAMANAQEVVRQAANYITLSNEEDGVAHAVEKFMLNAE